MSWIKFFFDKKEHYPISDEFIEKYQQKDDGNKYSYITYAHNTGHVVDSKLHEPNQKWHLYESYFICKLIEKEGDLDFTMRGFKRPELLLWLAEAAEVEERFVREAATYASEKIDSIRRENPDGAYSSEAVKYMNDMFKEKYDETLWVKTVNKIMSTNLINIER